MHLSDVGLIHWSNLPNRHYRFDGINLVTGESGTGKTTLLDAIQTLMTAAMAGLYQYNAGQKETKQQSRQRKGRSLASYILGCDESRYARPYPCSGYIVGNFEPRDGEPGEPFCAVMAVSAYLEVTGENRDAKLKDTVMIIVRGHHLHVDDFKVAKESGSHIVTATNIERHLRLTRPELRTAIDVPRTKEEYLCTLYGALRGLAVVNASEAKAAAKQLSRFMSYNEIEKIDDFVRENVLEPEETQNTLKEVSDLMKNIDAMQRQAELVKAGVGLSEAALREAVHARDLIWKNQCHHYELYARDGYRAVEDMKKLSSTIEKNVEQVNQWDDEVKQLGRDKEAIDKQLRQLQAQLDNIPVMTRKQDLEWSIKQARETLEDLAKQFFEAEAIRQEQLRNLKGWQQYMLQSVDEWQEWMPDASQREYWHQQLQSMYKTVDDPAIQLVAWVQPDFDGKAPDSALIVRTETELTDLAKACKAQREDWDERHLEYRQALKAKSDAVGRLKEEIERLETGKQVTYHPDTTKALAMMKHQLPDANARILCEHVEVTDSDWQMAIESIMGARRFAILVDPVYEEAALDLIKEAKLNKATLVQGGLARDRQREPVGRSIVHLMHFSDPLVEAYITASFGNVEQIHTFADLKRSSRGLMMDGRSTGAFLYRVQNLSEADLVFGRQARERALAAKKGQLEALTKEEGKVALQTRSIKKWLDFVDKVGGFRLSQVTERLTKQRQLKREAQSALEQLDISDYEALIEKQQELIDKEKSTTTDWVNLQSKQAVLQKGILDDKEKLVGYERQTTRLDALQESYLTHLYILEDAGAPETVESVVDGVDERLDQEAFCFPKIEQFAGVLVRHIDTCEQKIMEFNRLGVHDLTLDASELIRDSYDSSAFEPTARQFQALINTVCKVTTVTDRLKDDVLAQCQKTIEEMAGRFNNIFVSSVCYQTYNHVENGAKRLKRLNMQLRNHVFGREYYQFEYSFVPQYRDYYQFFKEVSTLSQHSPDQAQGALFGEEMSLSPTSQKIFEEIKEKLLEDDPDEAALAQSRLEALVDYRNYRTYDIVKVFHDGHQVSLKKNASGSGGQMETPGYVIRAAGLASALRTQESKVALRMLMIDESFAKMDEQRSLQVLSYLRDTLGFQIIFVVPSIKMGPFVPLADRQFEVVKTEADDKVGELDTVVVVSDKALKKVNIQQIVSHDKARVTQHCENLTFEQLLSELDHEESHELDG